MPDSAYARVGVDQRRAEAGTAALINVLGAARLDTRGMLGSGHYAEVLRLSDALGLAVACDGVGSKVIVCEQLEEYRWIGIDLVGMNANDVICVGAEPIALLDYIAVEDPDPGVLERIAEGLGAGAAEARLEIPGGETAVLPELIQGHPEGRGFDLIGFCLGTVSPDKLVTGSAVTPGDAIIGIPSSGIHANGFTLARRALPDLYERPPELAGATVGEVFLRPTVLYVRAVTELVRSNVDVHGLAHITSTGFLNLGRLRAPVGFLIDNPLPVPPIFELIQERRRVEPKEMYEVFNMGCGFCCVVPAEQAESAIALLSKHHPGTAVIGRTTDNEDLVELPFAGLAGTRNTGFAPV